MQQTQRVRECYSGPGGRVREYDVQQGSEHDVHLLRLLWLPCLHESAVVLDGAHLLY